MKHPFTERIIFKAFVVFISIVLYIKIFIRSTQISLEPFYFSSPIE
ncbi:hypothetical protein HMPREF1987_01881 [Peptostreptococcaceae bacterium oral taxon 113 str. W5053]|nr:hypothetical protein HMPREF1987_01881 [Peptostreptococcaceae bacterium oral taxon 113 str. W5053]